MDFQKVNACKGEVTIPGDKSISHRAVMFGALAKGTTKVSGFLKGADCLSTIACFKQLGIDIEELKLFGNLISLSLSISQINNIKNASIAAGKGTPCLWVIKEVSKLAGIVSWL